MKFFKIACFLLLPLFFNAQVYLIPTPQKVELEDCHYVFPDQLPIYTNNIDQFHSGELIEVLNHELNTKTTFSNKEGKHTLVLEKLNSKEDFLNVLKLNSLDQSFTPGDEGYVLIISTKRIQLFAQTGAGIFYGIQTLKQLITSNMQGRKLPCMVIYDKPDISVRAWQDDISRGPIPTMELLKEQIRSMSSFKLNHFTLYTEHVFKLDKHPGIAPPDGISKEELKELSEFAEKYHVTLIGNYQSFGHMEETLSHPDYQHLAENDHIISPALEESYTFLSDVYQEIVPQYGGKYFNINCDETFGLGEGKSKAMVDSIGISGVYINHINRLNDILKIYDKQILMWGDIVTSYPEIVPLLPKDITVMAWGYHPAASFDYAITPITDQNLNFWVAPGVNCWQNIYPNLQASEINIYNFIRDGYKLGATGILNTSWDDDGLNFLTPAWHGFAWGAANSWNVPPSGTKEESELDRENRYQHFNKSFDLIYYGLDDNSITDVMHTFSLLHQSEIRAALKNSRFFEPIFPIHYDYVQDGKKEANLYIQKQLDTIQLNLKALIPKIKRNKQTTDYILFAIKQTQFTINKNLFRIELHDYLAGDSAITTTELKIQLKLLIDEVDSLKETYITLWHRECRNWWLQQNIEKFDKLKEDLITLEGHCIITAHNEVNESGRKISMRSTFDDLPVHYTINKDTVTKDSPVYSEPITISEDATIMARTINKNNTYPIATKKLLYHKGIGHLYKLNSSYSEYHPSYNGGGKHALLDGQLGNKEELRSGNWQGFSGQDIEIEIDLQSQENLHSFSMGFFQNTRSWVIFPTQVEIYCKDKLDEPYQLIATIVGATSPEEKGSLKENYTTTFDNLKTRYIKVVARYYGKLPEWHHAGSQYESMIFSDEIILK